MCVARGWLVAACASLAVLVGPLGAQEENAFKKIAWARGPVVGDLGDEAEIRVPAGCLFADAKGTSQFMELTQNPTSGNERGVVLCGAGEAKSEPWFVIFSYDASGYVRDDDKD